jgi:Methyltransferase domain
VPAPEVSTYTWWQQFPARAALRALPYVPRIPQALLDEVFPGIDEQEITLSHKTRARALGPGEAFVLALVTAFTQPERIFEIGTASGQATLLMAQQAPAARIDTMDLGNERPSLGEQRGQPPWQDLSTIGVAYKESPHADRVTQHFADSARFDYAPFHGAMDLVFVDGGHTYEYVRSDSRQALAMARPGATIVWDDCTYISPGVSRALVELQRDGRAIYRIPGTRLAVHRVPA